MLLILPGAGRAPTGTVRGVSDDGDRPDPGLQDDGDRPVGPWGDKGYNKLALGIAIGVVIGLALFWAGDAGTTAEVAGRALVLFSLGSMLAAALVLVTSGAKYLRPAAIQGTLPLIGFVLFLFA